MTESTASTPDEIRDEIEQTRAELGDTVDALTAKLDVKTQVKDRVAGAKSSVTDAVTDAASKAKQATPAPVQNVLGQAGATLNQASAKASPLVEQARPYGKQIAAGVAAVLVLLFALRRRSK
jgi:Protein of unknown function (DUF3618)